MDASIPKGEILFNITGGSWNRSEMIHNEGMSPEEFSEKVGFCLIPAGKKGGRPVSLSHPIVYTVNKDTKHPEIVMEILKIASRSELNLKHALQSSHLAIRREEAAMREYKNQPFLEKATAFLKYTRFLPNHEYYPIYENLFFGAIQSVEMSGVSPEQALRELIAKTRDLIGSEIEIREE
jgi:inositol-phosphate transport system substrate-binding protein